MPLSEEHVECWGRIVEAAREEHDRRAAILGVVQRWDDVTILAVDAELSRLRAVAEAARAFDRTLQWTPGHAFPAHQTLKAALAALDGHKGERQQVALDEITRLGEEMGGYDPVDKEKKA